MFSYKFKSLANKQIPC